MENNKPLLRVRTSKKIRVVWSNGTIQYFDGSLRFYSNTLWIVDTLSGNRLYIPAYNIRSIGTVGVDGDNCGI